MGANASRDIIEYALEQSCSRRGAHRSTDQQGLSPRRITLTALVAGAVTATAPGLASAAGPVDRAERGAVPRPANVSQQIAATQQKATQQKAGNLSSAQPGALLTNGTRGTQVRKLQRVLNAWYPSKTPLAEDGIYGPKTEDRVRYLQERADIAVDGITGPNTLGVLNMSAATSGTSQIPANSGGSSASSNQDSTSAASASESSDDASDEDAAVQLSAEAGAVVSPTSGQVTSSYGDRAGHNGVDIANDIGTPIYATTDGVVIEAGPASGFGLWVRVQHDDGAISVYGHINEALVSEGQNVEAGEQIATMGNRGYSTGPHLHFEIWQNGGQKIDPAAWLAQYGVSL